MSDITGLSSAVSNVVSTGKNNLASKTAALQKELARFIFGCANEDLPLLAGTEMNAPGQLLVDDFENPALKKHLALLLLGVDNFC